MGYRDVLTWDMFAGVDASLGVTSLALAGSDYAARPAIGTAGCNVRAGGPQLPMSAGEMARTRAITLLTAAGLLLTGAAAPPVSRRPTSPSPAFVAAADAICAAQLAQLNRLAQPTTAEQAISYLPQALSDHRARARQRSRRSTRPPASGPQFAARARRPRSSWRRSWGASCMNCGRGSSNSASFSRAQAESDALRADIDAHFRQAGLAQCAR